MRRLVFLTLVLAASLCGQDVVKVFTVKPANTDRIRRTLEMVVGKEHVAAEAGSSTLVVTTASALMPSVEQVVKDLDVLAQPAQNVELTFYVLRGSKEPEADAGPLPAELEPTIKQLKSTFAYQSFRLIDTIFIRGRSGQFADVSGRAEAFKGVQSHYRLRVSPSVSSNDRPSQIRLNSLQFNLGGPGVLDIDADVDIKEGQKVVIGKSGLEGSALILVATGKVVE
jgi:hypothetical protein